MKTPTPKKDERLLEVHQLALDLYTRALAFDGSGEENETLNERIMAVMLAAVWIAAEGGVPNPWQREYGPSPKLNQEMFMEWATAMWDGWMRERPRAHLTLIHGGPGSRPSNPS